MRTEQQPWHLIGVEATLDAQRSSPEGLSRDDAEGRLQVHGPYRLPEPPRRSRIVRFAAHFHNILIYVLLGSALITSLLDHLTDTLVILGVVFANAVIGFIQEGKAEKAMDTIRTMLALKASVFRDGASRYRDSAYWRWPQGRCLSSIRCSNSMVRAARVAETGLSDLCTFTDRALTPAGPMLT